MYFSDIVYETNTIYSIPLCNQMIVVLKHSGFPRSCCFQIENTVSKLEENIEIKQITELSIVNWVIIMCAFLIFAHTFGHGTQAKRNLLRIFLSTYEKQKTLQVSERQHLFVQALFHIIDRMCLSSLLLMQVCIKELFQPITCLIKGNLASTNALIMNMLPS